MKILNHFIGTVGSEPRAGTTADGKRWLSFRMAVSQDGFNPSTGAFEEYDTTWFDVSAFGALAENLFASLHKGEPVIVVGRLRVREWQTEEKSGSTPQVVAEMVGHNMRFGATRFSRAAKRPDGGETAQETVPGTAGAPGAGGGGPGGAAAGAGGPGKERAVEGGAGAGGRAAQTQRRGSEGSADEADGERSLVGAGADGGGGDSPPF